MDILNQFGIKPVLLAAQAVNFLILLFILKKFLYGPILKVLKERKDKIAQSLKNAEEIERKLKEASEEGQRQIAKAIAEGEKIMKETEAVLAQMSKDEQAKVQVIVDKMIADGRIQMQQDGKKLESEIKENFTKFVTLIFEKVTGKALKKDQVDLIEEAVKKSQ